jgi:hypothetical protein
MDKEQLFVKNSDEIIVSDITNKLKTTPQETIVKICHKFYSDHVVTFEKQKIFTSIGETSRNPRTDKRLKDLDDILATVTRKDEAGDKIPKFVSINMSNLKMEARLQIKFCEP